MNNFAHTYTEVTIVCVYFKEHCHFISLILPAVMRRRARLFPFGESVYVRLLLNSPRSNRRRRLQSLRVPSGALMGL